MKVSVDRDLTKRDRTNAKKENMHGVAVVTRKGTFMDGKELFLKNCEEAQNSPCTFGTFCIIYNGKIIAGHPINNKRFINIMGANLSG